MWSNIVKYKELTLQHLLYVEMPFTYQSLLHSHINKYGRLFTSGPRKTLCFFKSIRGGNLHDLTNTLVEIIFINCFAQCS